VFPAITIATPQARRLQQLMALRVSPAVAGGAIVFNHSGRVGEGMAMIATTLVASSLIESRSPPSHLTPVTSLATRAAAVVAAVFVMQLIRLGAGSGLDTDGYVAPLVGAWIVLAFGFWTSVRFQSGREVRIATIGGAWRRELDEELSSAGVRGHRVVGWIDSEAGATSPRQSAHCLGSIEEGREILIDHNIDLLVHDADPATDSDQAGRRRQFDQLTAICSELPVRMIAANELYETTLGRVRLNATSILRFRTAMAMRTRLRTGTPLSERLLDLAVASPLTLLAAPLIGLGALAIKLSGGGPVLYRQRRIGEGGKAFDIVKLRSMRTDAETSGQATWSGAGDDRVTSVGRFLRRTHIDELPQLANVLRGEMSLVGPRPERASIVKRLERQLPAYGRRHMVKPGITGWAQVHCGYSGSADGSARKLGYDLHYLEHHSVPRDLMIMLETLHATVAIDQYGPEGPQPKPSGQLEMATV
jgi:exopolysaccharide biosynthesis polyprenyl glycosylphosphotransferase